MEEFLMVVIRVSNITLGFIVIVGFADRLHYQALPTVKTGSVQAAPAMSEY